MAEARELEILQSTLTTTAIWNDDEINGLEEISGKLLNLEECSDPMNTNEVTKLCQEALALCSTLDDKCGYLNRLAIVLYTRFELQGNLHDIDKAILLHREVLALFPTPCPDRGKTLNSLANAIHRRFEQQGDLNDIDEAITLHRELLTVASQSDPCKALDSLATVIHSRFKHHGNPSDIDEVIALHKKVLALCPTPHPYRCETLDNLATAMHSRFQQCGDPDDIDKAITHHREALTLCPTPHPNRGNFFNNLATAIHSRFQQYGEPSDIDEAIMLHREALVLHPMPHSNHSTSLINLAFAIHSRFQQRGDPSDINEAILHHREALALCPTPHPNRSDSLNNLALALHSRFEQQGDPHDIDEAIAYHKEALTLCPLPYSNRSKILNNLAIAINSRFEQRGDPGDIDEAIEHHREALALRPAPHPNRSNSLSNLATVIHSRFELYGDPSDIDQVIERHREVLTLYPRPHPNYSNSLNNLAAAIHSRYQQRRDPGDIDEAIALHREALTLRPISHPNRGNSLNNLAAVILSRFRQHGDSSDIDEVIAHDREVPALRPMPHPNRSDSLNNLAGALDSRFRLHGNSSDIDEAIAHSREALALCTTPHPNHTDCLNNLAQIIYSRFKQHNDPGDINEVIMYHREALALRHTPHHKRNDSLSNLADAIYSRFQQQDDFSAIDQVITLLKEAATYKFSSPISQFFDSMSWAHYATKHNHSTWLEAYQLSINLLPQFAALDLDIKSRQYRLARPEVVSLAANSAASAIHHERNDLAVEFLETSRSIFWAQALRLRTPLDQVAVADPVLASTLWKISRELEQSSFRDNSWKMEMTQQHRMLMEDEGRRCGRLNVEREKTVKAIRNLPGFVNFLQPLNLGSLRHAAVSGPVVILLASESSSSALIVKQIGDVKHVQLPKWTPQMTQLCADLPHILSHGRQQDVSTLMSNRQNFSDLADLQVRLLGQTEGYVDPDTILCNLLAELWRNIVKPIFQVLNFNKSEHRPRLWWCPTGCFAFLPIHAAGVYNGDTTDCVADYVVSSYTPTLTALLDRPAHTTAPFKMMAVIEPNAPKCNPLPGTEEELAKIKSHVPNECITTLKRMKGSDVLNHLQGSSIVHFACHGSQDSSNPLDSGLMLADGCLKVSQIMQGQDGVDGGRRKSMSLAFLSACETAKGDNITPDEAMHLAASLLFAGFRSVVATMWTINDLDGPKVADAFYEYLFKGCDPSSTPPVLPDLFKAAEALDFAILKLRNEPGIGFLRWVPFVHYGL